MNETRALQEPSVFFRYQSVSDKGIEHFEDTLRNNQIWFSSPRGFNDPFDCRRAYDTRNTPEDLIMWKMSLLLKKGFGLTDALVQAEKEMPKSAPEAEAWQRRQLEANSRRLANTAVLCLTPICDNPVMWAHYADKHAGICIMFHALDERHVEFIAEARRVDYADRLPVINFVKEDFLQIVQRVFFTKSTHYRYEQEWRIVRYDDGPGLKPIPRGLIGAVILGVKMDDALSDRVRKACAEYEGDVEIIRAELDPNTFGMRFEKEEIV